ADALQGLSEAKAGLLVQDNKQETEQKRKEDFVRLMGLGKAALEKKQYLAAVRAFDSALKLEPTDPEASKALDEAQDALKENEAEKKKLEEFQTHMRAAQVAMASRRYDEAAREFLAAQQLAPQDLEAAQGLQLARQSDAYTQAMTQGDAARREKRYADAV